MTVPDRNSDAVPFPWQRIAIIATVIAVVVAGLWQFIGAFDDTGIEPSTLTNAASPDATGVVGPVDATPTEPVATPDIEPEWPLGSLPAMLELAPDRLADGSLPLNDIATYADLARWMAARGVPVPSSATDPGFAAWEDELAVLALPQTLRANGLDPAWQAAYGFSLLDVQQVLQVGQAPDYVVIMRGAFDPDVLQAAWVASGYQPVEIEGMTAWSLTPGDAIDLSPAASRPAMGSLNNVILLDDGTLVGAARTSRLADTLRAIQGKGRSLAENDAIAAFLTPGTGIERIGTAILSQGSLLRQTTGDSSPSLATPASATPVATPGINDGMPPVRAILVGLPLPTTSDGATPIVAAAPGLTIMLSVDNLDAALEGRDWIAMRYPDLASPVTGVAYAERFGDITLRVIEAEDDPAAIVISASLERGLADWLAMIADRDLGFAAWDDGG